MNNELYHHGVLGMKWGVRKDRSTVSKKSSKKTQTKKKISVKDMSDDEIRKAVNRLNLEKQLKLLSTENVSKGKIYTDKILKASTTIAAASGSVLAIYNNYGKIRGILAKQVVKKIT